MALRLPRLIDVIPVVNTDNGHPLMAFIQWWNDVANQVEVSVNSINDTLVAAGLAQAAADAAQASADAAQAAADSATGVTMVVGSGVDVNPLTSTDAGSDASIVVTTHNRIYSDGTSVSVTGNTITGLAYSTLYYVYYDDADMLGGAVTYQVTQTSATAAQTGSRHLVGSITTPAALDPDNSGEYIPPPGIDRLQP